MGQKQQVLDKIARNLEIQGESVSRSTAGDVVVENGSADITVSYASSSTTPSMLGGVDDHASPFLGIGQGNPGKITLKVASADALADVLATAKAVKAFAICAAFANDIQLLKDADSSVLLEVRGHPDRVGMGQ